jgi:hypothetical protein
LAALSDLNGQLQPRDILRFVAVAARESHEDRRWTDRLLTPTAVKRAVEICGVEKVSELGEENPELKEIFEQLSELDPDLKVTPFSAEQAGLDSARIRAMEIAGIIFREGETFNLPEIFRLGLGFRLRRGARPRVLALLQKVARASRP